MYTSPTAPWRKLILSRCLLLCLLPVAFQVKAAPPDISSSDYVIVDFWSGFRGFDEPGGSGKIDGISIEATELSIDGAGGFSYSASDFIIERDVDEAPNDLSVGADQDFIYELDINTTTSNPMEVGGGTYTITEEGKVVLTDGGESFEGFVGPGADTLIRFEQETEMESENLALGFGVRKPSGLGTGDLSGMFVVYGVQRGFGGTVAPEEVDFVFVERFEFTFDGAGGFTETSTAAGFSRVLVENNVNLESMGDEDMNLVTFFSMNEVPSTPDSDSGTYAVSGDGVVTLDYGGGDISQAQLGADLNTVVFAGADVDVDLASVIFGMGVRKGSGMTNSDIVGEYTILDWEFCIDGAHPEGGWGKNDEILISRAYVTVFEDGTFKLRADEWWIQRSMVNDDPVDNNPGEPGDNDTVVMNKYTTMKGTGGPFLENGTYTLSPTGAIVLNFIFDSEPDSISGQVSADGQTIVFGETDFEGGAQEACANFGVGIRRVGPTSHLFGMDCGAGDDGMTGSGYRMSVCIDPGENFQVLKSNNLTDGWEVFTTMTAAGSETTLTDTSALGLPSGYYVLVFTPW